MNGDVVLDSIILIDHFNSVQQATPPIADLAAQLRREHRWKLPDALQAAAARQHGLRLATRNTKDFPPQRYAFVHVPYTL